MTKKDYERIATALRDSAPIALSEIGAAQAAQFRFTVGRLASSLEADNPLFDRERFMRAVGVE